MAHYHKVAINSNVLEITTDLNTVSLQLDATYDTARMRLDLLEQSPMDDFSDIWLHVNRDGSLTVATGPESLVWPEDDVVFP